ncbi:MAG: hypothetical protein RIA63_13680, partial [Cyclobacteriaceae bacterium]
PFLAFSQRDLVAKTAQIISFRIESRNPGIDNQTLLLPLSQELNQLFRFADVAMAENITIQWKGESPFNKFKKLSKKELQLTSANNNLALLKIEIEHRYNPVLGGIISRSRRHVMKLRIALFTSTGKRVWYHKRKDSCCINLGVDEEDEFLFRDMDAASFVELYDSVLRKTFGKQ